VGQAVHGPHGPSYRPVSGAILLPMGRGHERGKRGEGLAAEFLVARGWTILERNWRDGPRELDLVALRDGVLAFVEVKTRSGGACGSPLEGITRRKRREVERAAAAWLQQWGDARSPLRTIRFDAVAVHLSPDRGRRGAEVVHLEDAWWRGE
jgi:putative endonuclease